MTQLESASSTAGSNWVRRPAEFGVVPLVWENYSFQWASVDDWRYDPWATGPDLTAVWLDPASP